MTNKQSTDDVSERKPLSALINDCPEPVRSLIMGYEMADCANIHQSEVANRTLLMQAEAKINQLIEERDSVKAAGIREAVEAMEPWQEHAIQCDWHKTMIHALKPPCTCGLTALLDELKGEGRD